MEHARSVAIGFWVGIGSRDEEDRLAGASHFLEHLLFKGTPERSARSIAEAVDAVGGDMNAFTTKEYTAFYVKLLSEHLDLGLDILSDVIWSPALRLEDFEAERDVILEEIRMHADEPSDVAQELVFQALFPDHPLGREVLGLAESVESMRVEDIRDFFSRYYRPPNMVVAAAGDLEHDRLAEGLESRFAGTPGGSPPRRSAPAAEVRPLLLAERPTEQAHIVVGVRAPDRHSPARWTLDTLNHALGGGISSRLFQEIRERRGLAYSVYSDRVSFDDAGAISVYVGTAPEKAGEVMDLLGSELDALAEGGITPPELEVARGHIRADALLALEDSAARMGRIGRSLLLHDEVLPVEELLRRVDSVTTESVAELASLVLGSARGVALVGPEGPEGVGA
jgi:predicted Zn-dependent peptidase